MIRSLANKYKLRLPRRGGKVLNKEQLVYLQFFERPDITYINPRCEGNVQVGVINREKIFSQKRHLFRAAKNGQWLAIADNFISYTSVFLPVYVFYLVCGWTLSKITFEIGLCKKILMNRRTIRDIAYSSCVFFKYFIDLFRHLFLQIWFSVL